MSRWRCPACNREFARANQSHVCVPGNTVAQTFAGRPPVQRQIYESVIGYLRTLGPVHVDAVKVGVFLKRTDKLAEIRPMSRCVALWLCLPGEVDDPRVSRSERISAGRFVHLIKLAESSEVDDQLRRWLATAYDAAG